MSPGFLDALGRFVSESEWARSSGRTHPLRWVVSTNGGAHPDDNVILFGFGPGSREPLLVAKVPRRLERSDTLRNEFERLSELWLELGPDAASLLPEPIALASLHRQSALILSYVRGETPPGRGRRSPWNDPRKTLALVTGAARCLRSIHQRTARPVAGDDPATGLLELQAARFERCFDPRGAERSALHELTAFACGAFAAATRGVMSHADFWSGNLIAVPGGGLVLLDWQFARRTVDASLDVYLLLAAGALEHAADVPREQRARAAARRLADWRARVMPAYLAEYGDPGGHALLPPRLGLQLCCVEKAVRSRLHCGLPHPDDELWRELFAELAGDAGRALS